MGGEYVENNVISVEVTNCNKQTANHVMWHYANWQLWGKEEDLLAWRGLAGFYDKEDVIREKLILGGKTSGSLNRDTGHIKTLGEKYGALAMAPGGWLYENRDEYARLGYEAGIAKPENRMTREDRVALAQRIYASGKGLASLTKIERQEIGKKAGEVSGQKHKENGTGVCGIPAEEHSKRMSETNKQKWRCPECEYTNIARHVNKHMKEEHNLPKKAKLKMVG
jgi:hypothetical protein